MHRTACYTVALACVFALSSPAQVCAPPPGDLVSWWDGDAVTPTNAQDIFGSNPASFVNGASTVPGWVGQAFSFDGQTGYLDAGGPVLQASGGPLTVEAWIKPNLTGSGYQGLVGEIGSANTPGEFLLRLNPAMQLEFLCRTVGGGVAMRTATTTAITPGVWTHVVAGCSGGGGTFIRINGRTSSSSSTGGASYTSVLAARTTIGAAEPGKWLFDGEIDEVTLYRRNLPDAEITRIYQAGALGKCKTPAVPPSDLAGWWDADTVCSTYALDLGGGDSLRYDNTSSGMAGRAFSFDGTNHATAGRPIVLADSSMSVEAWIHASRISGVQAIVSEIGTGSSPGQHMLRLWSNGRLQFYYEDPVGGLAMFSSTTVPANEWTHVAATYDSLLSEPLRIYINGMDVSSSSNPAGYTATAPVETRVGAADDRYHFLGSIDEPSYYRRALNAGEVQALFVSGAFGKDKTMGKRRRLPAGDG